MRSRGLVPTLVAAGLLAAAIVLTVPRAGPSSLMEDGDLTAASIGLDHQAMLAADPKKNAAFMRVFGSYVDRKRGDALAAGPAATTQLAQQRHSSGRKARGQDMNSRLASEMQAKLTAGSEDDEMMTPHFVAALNVANGNQMLASTDEDETNEKALKALSMTSPTATARSHILPAKLREKFEFTKDKHQVAGNVLMTPNQAALRANPIGSSNTQALSAVPMAQGNAAASADNKLLASAPEGLSTKQLIQQAALRQMNTLSSSSSPSAAPASRQPAPKVSLQSPMQGPAAYTQQMYQQPAQYPSPMYQAPQQPYAYVQAPRYPQQQLYNGYATTWPESGYRPPNAPQQAGSWYPAQQPSAYSQEVPQRLAGYEAPVGQTYPPQYAAPAQEQQLPYQPLARTQMAYQYPPAQQEVQAPAQTQDLAGAGLGGVGSSTSSAPIMSATAVGKAAANAAAPDWRSPDATIKGKGGLASKKAQMEALRTQILSDYKANTRDAEKALLMGPGLN